MSYLKMIGGDIRRRRKLTVRRRGKREALRWQHSVRFSASPN